MSLFTSDLLSEAEQRTAQFCSNMEICNLISGEKAYV